MRPGWKLIELIGGPHDGALRWMPIEADGPYFAFSNKHREPGTCKAPGWSSVSVYQPREDGTKYDYRRM